MPSDKYSSHPLSEKLIFAEDREHYRNPQLVKMQWARLWSVNAAHASL